MRYYVLNVTINSQGTENRNFTPYDVKETALRKFFEPLCNIGAGPKKITVILYDEDLNIVKKESWEAESEVEE